jgi:hypothetical protein
MGPMSRKEKVDLDYFYDRVEEIDRNVERSNGHCHQPFLLLTTCLNIRLGFNNSMA